MSQPSLAPIVLFVYNRPWHTLETLKTLKANDLASQSKLYIFCDGPKPGETEERLQKIKEVRAVIRQEQWCKEVIIIEQEKNLGLANSITQGVTKIVNEYGTIIVLEDDLITSPHFLRFMNDALVTYANDGLVACISGYIYPVKETLPQTFFMKGAECWGWATWKRAWHVYESDGEKLLAALEKQKLTTVFDFGNSVNFTQMLRNQIAGKNNSWCIRWYASAFLRNMVCLYPGISLVRNIGLDGSGTHCEATDSAPASISYDPLTIVHLESSEDKEARKKVVRYFQSINPHSRFKLFLLSLTPPKVLAIYRSCKKKLLPSAYGS
jgi:hypothetical protein